MSNLNGGNKTAVKQLLDCLSTAVCMGPARLKMGKKSDVLERARGRPDTWDFSASLSGSSAEVKDMSTTKHLLFGAHFVP